MFKQIAFIAAVSLVAAPGLSAGQAGEPPAAAAAQRAEPAKEAQFLAMAYQDGQKEIALANLAGSKAQNPQVKALAEKIRTDHQAAGKEIEKLAAGTKLTLPSAGQDQQTAVTKFQKLSADDFDREYATLMVAEHEKAIKAFSDAATSSGGEVKAFAEKTLPTLREHLQAAQAIAGGGK